MKQVRTKSGLCKDIRAVSFRVIFWALCLKWCYWTRSWGCRSVLTHSLLLRQNYQPQVVATRKYWVWFSGFDHYVYSYIVPQVYMVLFRSRREVWSVIILSILYKALDSNKPRILHTVVFGSVLNICLQFHEVLKPVLLKSPSVTLLSCYMRFSAGNAKDKVVTSLASQVSWELFIK